MKTILLNGSTKEKLEQYKSGAKTESAFIQEMLQEIFEVTQVRLESEQFKRAWNAMNKPFSEFGARLLELLRENSGNKGIYIFSNANSLDMQHFVDELRQNKIEYELDEQGALKSISVSSRSNNKLYQHSKCMSRVGFDLN